ncbi:MAG: DegT/DnrJ/EryC1/StrS family aminotransferase [Phycisphaerae bacterium]
MNVPMLDLRKQYQAIKNEVLPAIEAVCESQACCLGPAVDAFEKEAAIYCGCAHAIGVSSGTDALLVSLMAAGVEAGDEVIVPSFTFAATTGVVARLGAVPVFVDIDEYSFNVNPAFIEERITEKTKAIIPVHLYGQMAQMEPIMSLAAQYGFAVIEDSAQSIGAEQGGRKSGSIGDYGCFSFYPTKNLGAFGDGGMITTNDAELDRLCRMIRNHGQNAQYEYERLGGNFRLDGIQGAVLSVKLKHLKSWEARRRANAAIYDRMLAGVAEVSTPVIEEGNYSVYNQYTIKAERRDELKAHLTAKGIGCAVYYPYPLHLQKCFASLGWKEGSLPVTERICTQVLSLPISSELEAGQVEYVAEAIKEFYE